MTTLIYRRIEIELDDGDKESLKDWLFAALQSYAELHNPGTDDSIDLNEALTALAMVTAAVITAENDLDPDAVLREHLAFGEKLNVAILTAMSDDAFDDEAEPGRPN